VLKSFFAGEIPPEVRAREHDRKTTGLATTAKAAVATASSTDFQNDSGTLGAGNSANDLYENVLHRAGDSGGLAFWTNFLTQGGSKATAVVGFADRVFRP
jgi:hypothetical protein